jgi:hypothetical protein
MDLDMLAPLAHSPPPTCALPAAVSYQLPLRPTRSSRRPPPPIPQGQKRSYADMARNMASLVALTRTLPDLDPDCIVTAHQAALSTVPSSKCQLHTTTTGPSLRQILILLEVLPSANTFPTLVGTINRALGKKSSLWVQSIHHAYRGLFLLTNNVASLPKLEQVANAVRSGLGWDSLVSASLPQSRSYLKIVDIPILKPGSTDKIDSAFARKVMLESPVGHLISLASSPRVMRNTCHSDTTTV